MKQTVSSEALQLVCSNYIRILTPHCSFVKMRWQRNRAFITEILFESKKNPPRCICGNGAGARYKDQWIVYTSGVSGCQRSVKIGFI